MYVRVMTLEGIDPDVVAEHHEAARDATRPVLQGMRGYKGAAQMLDREGRRLRTAVFFESREDIDAAEAEFQAMPQRLPEALRAQVTSVQRTVDVFEVLGQDRLSIG